MKQFQTLRRRFRTWDYNRNSNIKYYNFWLDQRPEEMWFTRFIQSNFPNKKLPRINFTSVLGSIDEMKDNRRGLNIFYTGENLHADRFSVQRNMFEKQHYDLSLGFDTSDASNYLRLPLWILWCFPPDANRKTINKIVQAMRYPTIGDRKEFCCLICSHDQSGIRSQIMDKLSTIGAITSAGRFRNNTDALQKEFNDDKVSFMRQFKFAICPENSDAFGYVTEKIFDAILSGCIPIYTGSSNQPEPTLINSNAIIFWNPAADNNTMSETVKLLGNSPQAYMNFAMQARLTDDAEEVVWQYYAGLKKHFEQLLS